MKYSKELKDSIIRKLLFLQTMKPLVKFPKRKVSLNRHSQNWRDNASQMGLLHQETILFREMEHTEGKFLIVLETASMNGNGNSRILPVRKGFMLNRYKHGKMPV